MAKENEGHKYEVASHLPSCLCNINLHLTGIITIRLRCNKDACNSNAGICIQHDVKPMLPFKLLMSKIAVRLSTNMTLLITKMLNYRQIQKLQSTIKLDMTEVTASTLRQNDSKLIISKALRMKHPRYHQIILRPENAT